MACRWRIRHKLTLGLALVVGIMALLSGGTLKGLLSYRWTMKTINSRLAELKAAQRLQENVDELTALVDGEPTPSVNYDDLDLKVAVVQAALTAYERQLADTMNRGRDADNGFHESMLSTKINGLLLEIARQTSDASNPTITTGATAVDDPLLRNIRALKEPVLQLRETIHTDMSRRIVHARADYHFSIALVSCTSVLGVLLLLALARLSYRWIVDPIRDLHEKVGHLAEGNFESRIEVKSGDEMQDLAEAFNNMTGRLQAIYSDLARQVNERSRQLIRSEKLAGIGFLAAGVAHEINNPLASIAFCSEALERRLFSNDERGRMKDETDARQPGASAPRAALTMQGSQEETVRNYLKMIQEEAFRCKNITQKLLEFSRVGERQKQETDLQQLIESVIDMVRHHQGYKEKRIAFEVQRRAAAVLNAEEIKSVVLNLVVNALDSMAEGGRLTITLDTWEQMAVMTFADTGCGMTAEVLENIFEPFFTRSRTGKGVGLGLSISHRIVSQHHGEIEATSLGHNQGSKFTVRLPLKSGSNPDILPLSKAA